MPVHPDNYKRAEICRQRMGPVLRRITMNFPPLLFHPVNSITAYKGQVIYDTPQTEAKSKTPLPYLHGSRPPESCPRSLRPTTASVGGWCRRGCRRRTPVARRRRRRPVPLVAATTWPVPPPLPQKSGRWMT